MKLLYTIWIILLLPVISEYSIAQNSTQSDFWKRFQLRHNLETKKEIAQPAFFQITAGRGFTPKIAAGLGLKVDLLAESSFMLGPFTEILWNTDIAKVQKNVRAGLDAEWIICQLGPLDFAPTMKMQVNYKGDYVGKTRGGQAFVSFIPVFNNSEWPLPNTIWRPFGEIIDIQYAPSVGTMLDNVTEADISTKVGPIWRAITQVDVLLRPFADSLNNRIEFSGTFAYRGDFSDPTSETDNDHPYNKIGITYYPVKDDSAKIAMGVGLSYIDGEDPTKGFEIQKYWQFGLTMKMGW